MVLIVCVDLSSTHNASWQAGAQRAARRLSRRLVLKLSKSGSGVWAPFPLSLDQPMEVWTTFYLSKTSKKGLYLTQGKENNTYKVDF